MTVENAAGAQRAYEDAETRRAWAAPELAARRRWRTRTEVEADTLAGIMFDREARHLARSRLRQADFTTARHRAIFAALLRYPDTVTVSIELLGQTLGLSTERTERWYATCSPATPTDDVAILADWDAAPV